MDSLENKIINSCYKVLEGLPNGFFDNSKIIPSQFMGLLRLGFIEKINKMENDNMLDQNLTMSKDEVTKIASYALDINKHIDLFIDGKITIDSITEHDLIRFAEVNKTNNKTNNKTKKNNEQ